MCNAHRHPPGCTCGWGGEGSYGGGHSTGSLTSAACSAHSSTRPARNGEWSERDFTHPSTCPECGADVFFIRYNGGCIWVDELGWPWPKHPCFDKASEPTRAFSLWSLNGSRLTNPRLGIVTRIKIPSGFVQIRLTDYTRVSLVLHWAPPTSLLHGELVIISRDDNLLLHPDTGEIAFHSYDEYPPAFEGWTECQKCKRAYKAGTDHICATSVNLSRLPLRKPSSSKPAQPANKPKRPKSKKGSRPTGESAFKAHLALKYEAHQRRIRQQVERISKQAWQSSSSTEVVPGVRLSKAKQAAIRLICMLSPKIRKEVENQFTSQKWAPLLSHQPKPPEFEFRSDDQQ